MAILKPYEPNLRAILLDYLAHPFYSMLGVI
jgi:hypothetical protein